VFNVYLFPTHAAVGSVQRYATFIFVDIVIWSKSDSPSLVSVYKAD
jgi:hypothetical protein